MKLSAWIISILLIGGIFVGAFTALQRMAGTEGHNVTSVLNDEQYSEGFDKIEETASIANATFNSIIEDFNADKTGINFFSGLWDVLKLSKTLVSSSFSITGDLITTTFNQRFGDMSIIIGILLGIVAVGFIFAIIELITKVRQ